MAARRNPTPSVAVYAPERGTWEESVARCRILVVEDEVMIAILVEDMVLDFGSEVVGPAAKMDEALRLASHATLDAAILDVNVGGAVVFPGADVLQERGNTVHFRKRLWIRRPAAALPRSAHSR